MKSLSVASFVALSLLLASPVNAQITRADANNDGNVNGTDYVVWLNNYNRNVSGGVSQGDYNQDGFVDGVDYVIWLNSYGTPAPSPSSVPSTYPRTITSSNPAVTFVETKAPEGNKIFIEARTNLPNIYRVNFYINNVLQNTDNTAPYFLNGDSGGNPTGYTLPSSTVEIKVSVGQDDGSGAVFTNAQFNYTLGGVFNSPSATPTATAGATSTPTPTPTATPVGSTPTDSKLTWSPPTLVDPITINLGTGATSHTLLDDRDYIIKLPDTKKNGGTTLVGGRNIHIIGGYITLPASPYPPTQRYIYIKDNGGEMNGRIVHIEGILMDSSGGGMGDAITMDADSAIVQVQNIRAVNLIGGQDTSQYDHTDLIQPWGGIKELRVDKFTGSTNYQGMQIQIDLGPIERATLKRTNMTYYSYPPYNGGYMVWLDGCGQAYPVTFSEVYVVPRSGRTLGKTLWPDQDNSTCGVVVNGNTATWPNLNTTTGAKAVTGFITEGSPPNGDFVPAGAVGLNYVSPGYR